MRKIHTLPPSLRPREKILKRGPASLTLTELIALILTTGTREYSVSTLATKIVSLIESKKPLTKESLASLGLGPAKTAQILAIIEIAARLQPGAVTTLITPAQVYAHSYEILDQEKEYLICFYLNARGELVKKEMLAVGALNTVRLLPREIFSHIKEHPIASIILVHNHPSGSLEPSSEDVMFTRRVQAAADILGVSLLDHLIVTKTGWQKIKW